MSLTDSMKRTNKRRVAKGAAWLDEVDPTWFNTVRVDQLQMSNGCRCVIGQLVRDIAPKRAFTDVVLADGEDPAMVPAALRGLILSMAAATRFGFEFDESRDSYEYDIDTDYAHLERLWINEITARRGGA